MKIVLFHINPIEWPGGCEKYFADLAHGLSEQGHQVVLAGSSPLYHLLMCAVYTVFDAISGNGFHLVLPSNDPPRNLGRASIQQVRLEALIPCTKARRRFKRLLRDADVIYCKNEWTDLVALRLFLPRYLLNKVVIGAHSSILLDDDTGKTMFGRIHNYLYDGPFYRRQLRESKVIHTPNAADAELVAKHYGLPTHKMIFIPYPLDGEATHSLRRGDAATCEPIQILFAQRLTHQKGLDYLADLVVSLSSTPHFDKLHFTIAGPPNGAYGSLAVDLAERFPNVTYRGFVADMYALYAEHDLVIVPSRWETFSYVTLEAQAAELPVIAFDIPGPNGIIVNEETGWLVPLGDVASLQSVMLRIVEQERLHPGMLAAMGRRSRDLAFARFGKEGILERQVAMLATVAMNSNSCQALVEGQERSLCM